MPLDCAMIEQTKILGQPYPKREKQAMDVPTLQRRGSTDLHAPILNDKVKNFPSIKEAVQ